MLKMRKKVFGLVVALTMVFGLSVTTMAAETLEPIDLDGIHDCMVVLSESQVNEPLASSITDPCFYSGKVYGYNSSTKTIRPAGEATWNWGPLQPDYIEIPKTVYWDLSGSYDYWLLKYTWNSKDCTYLKIKDRDNSNVYYNSSVKPNTNYTLSLYVKSLTSTVRLSCDYTLPGNIFWRDVQIGGLKVIY